MKIKKSKELGRKDTNQIVTQVLKKRECKRCLCKFVRWGNTDSFPNRPPITEAVKAKLESFLISHYAAEGGPFPENLKYYKYLQSLCDECLYSTMWYKGKEVKEEREIEGQEKKDNEVHNNYDDDEYNQWPGLDSCDYRGG